MHRYRPQEVVEVLRSARTDSRSPALAQVLECFRNRWLRWARYRYPDPVDQHEDAVQEAQLLVLGHIDQLRDLERVEAWANSVFLSVLREMSKKHKRRARWNREVKRGEDPDDILNRVPDTQGGPDDDASYQERRRIVREVASVDEVAWLKFEEGLSEKEIQERTGLSRNAIATRLKRIRKVLHRLLDETDEDGRPLPTSQIFDGIGLSRDLRNKLKQVIERLRGFNGSEPPDEGSSGSGQGRSG